MSKSIIIAIKAQNAKKPILTTIFDMANIKNHLGDIGVVKAIEDLHNKGYVVFMPVVSQHLPFDLISYKDGKCFRIQAKYRTDGFIPGETVHSSKLGNRYKKYDENDFEYYSIYIPEINKVVYPSIKFAGSKIRFSLPNSATPFYWWEDFVDFTDHAEKRNYREFGVDLSLTRRKTENYESTIPFRMADKKIRKPSKKELQKLIWKKPMVQLSKELGVCDKSIGNWCKSYGISKPPPGYWAKKKK